MEVGHGAWTWTWTRRLTASFAQGVDGVDRVGLGPDGADDAGAAKHLVRAVGGVERGKPAHLGGLLEVVGRGSHRVRV